MSEEGADLSCAECHAGTDHRVRGRGADLVASDAPGERLRCDDGSCHESTVHRQRLLNQHTARIACTTCHIPTYARHEPTDMFRDWSTIHYDTDKGKHTYHVETGQNVQPEYAWWNGTSAAQLPATPVDLDAEGRIRMAVPNGSKDDPAARLSPFKVHRGRLPVLDDVDWLLPIQTEELYAHGDVDRAVRDATASYYGRHDIQDIQYRWLDTIRFMGLFHEVQPAEHALGCLDCHGPDGRLDWHALGYDRDPLALCLQPSH